MAETESIFLPMTGTVAGPGERADTTGGLLNTARQMGGSLGMAAFGAVLATQSTFQAGLRDDTTATGALLIVLAAATIGLRQAR